MLFKKHKKKKKTQAVSYKSQLQPSHMQRVKANMQPTRHWDTNVNTRAVIRFLIHFLYK